MRTEIQMYENAIAHKKDFLRRWCVVNVAFVKTSKQIIRRLERELKILKRKEKENEKIC